MTRATLLQLLANPTALTGADVRALEQLATAFPYCQTAHLLLAKATHDQGSMLASQRLRRAATCAADRTRLRQLIELPPAAVEVLVAQEQPAAVAAHGEQPATMDAASAPTSYPPELPEPTPAAPANAPKENFTGEIISPLNSVFADLPEQVLEPVADQPTAPPAEAETPAATQPSAEEELPAAAPPIRPPAEATARTEFGLADAEPAELSVYQLPEPAALAAPPERGLPPGPATPSLPPFTGTAEVGYAPGEGSRLGFCLLPMAAEDATLPACLPPTGEFFAPDALVLAHLAAHTPAPAPEPVSSLDLINSFLQRAPTAARRRAMPSPAMPDTEAQADLSVRSTRPEHDMASESLAKILARQGKVDRAIAIYERLMVKHPEKMAYFAAQIESLRSEA